MKLKLYQLDAFANRPFEGNPAAVCPLEHWLDDAVMQNIASENNLSETAFFVKQGDVYDLRWFTPSSEVKLCGHATLASAYVIFNELGHAGDTIRFNTRSGELGVSRKDNLLSLDFPSQPPQHCELPQPLIDAINITPLECLKHDDYILVFESERDIRHLVADYRLLSTLDLRGVCITAPGDTLDFVSRFFAPKYGIDEDPVTGSSFTQLTPYWASKLDKSCLQAKQISPRGGEVECELRGERVRISGRVMKYMDATIYLDTQ